MNISLIVTTYNRPDALELALLSVARQTRAPDELIIADDGSTSETAELVAKFAAELPFPVIHEWQEDQGFRLARIRNLATARASGDYVIFLDGDMIVHPRFVEDHKRAALRGAWAQASRSLIGPERTREMIRNKDIKVTAFTPGIQRRRNAYRSRALAFFFKRPIFSTRLIKGCNQAFWRDDLIRVNGYNERFRGWGREDDELAHRMKHNGIPRRLLRFQALAYHLHHARSEHNKESAATIARTVDERLLRCDEGLDQHCP